MRETGLEELTASIRAQGILQPLLITPLGVVVAGHRRLAAAKKAGLTDVPVIVRSLSDTEQQELMLVENLQREDLSPIEEARAYRRLLDAGLTTRELARKVGVQPNRVSSRVQLLKLDETVQAMVHRGDLPLTLAPALARLTDAGRQRQVATMAARRALTVDELERIIERGAGALNAAPPPTTPVRSLPAAGPSDSDKGARFTPGRAATLERLEHLVDRSVSVDQLTVVFRDVCCACGMADLPEYCAACPMVQLVDGVLAKLQRSSPA